MDGTLVLNMNVIGEVVLMGIDLNSQIKKTDHQEINIIKTDVIFISKKVSATRRESFLLLSPSLLRGKQNNVLYTT